MNFPDELQERRTVKFFIFTLQKPCSLDLQRFLSPRVARAQGQLEFSERFVFFCSLLVSQCERPSGGWQSFTAAFPVMAPASVPFAFFYVFGFS